MAATAVAQRRVRRSQGLVRAEGDDMLNESFSPSGSTRGHRVRELVCAYRPLRDSDGRVVDVPTVVLNDARAADRRSARRGLRRCVSLQHASLARLACALARYARQHSRLNTGRVCARVSYTGHNCCDGVSESVYEG